MTSTSQLYRRLGAALAAALALSALASAEELSWRVSHGDVQVICPLTVGGSFFAKTSALVGRVVETSARPAVLGGAVVADLKSLDTGIGLRNDHLREDYLEVDKGSGFDKAELSDIHLADDWESFRGKTSFTGTFLLHGTQKVVTGTAEIRKEGDGLRVDASFPVNLSEFGIAKPRYLGVGVKDEVEAKVRLVLSPEPQGGQTR